MPPDDTCGDRKGFSKKLGRGAFFGFLGPTHLTREQAAKEPFAQITLPSAGFKLLDRTLDSAVRPESPLQATNGKYEPA
jgi:hypothetical protein